MATLRMHTRRKTKPQVGDVKIVDGIRYVRRCAMTMDPLTRKLTGLTRNGRTVLEWARA